jgi:hypothetical protein
MYWTCPECGKSFRNKNQWHSCFTLSLEDHLRNKPEKIQKLVYKLITILESFGPIELNPVKSVIQVKAGATFLSIKTKKEYVELEFQLGKEIEIFPIHRSVKISGNRVLHFLYLQSKKDINGQLIEWLKDSYKLVSQSI